MSYVLIVLAGTPCWPGQSFTPLTHAHRYTILEYEPIVEFGNLIGYDAFGLGNHDFDKGVDGLVPFIEQANYTVLSANIVSYPIHAFFRSCSKLQIGRK